MDIEVLIVDRDRVVAAPAGERGELLREAAFGDEADLDEEGWIWPSAADADWYGRYAFARTLGSYKPHFWAGERWEHVRDFAGPDLRSAVDRFVAALFWEGLEYVADPAETAGSLPERECPWDVNALMWRPPQDIAAIKGFWERTAPSLHTLREPFARHAATPTGWIGDFDSFAELLREWGEVVTEADRRGWAIVGLRG
ncbi:hypothetical protein [Streptomyces sp. NPDC054872]